MGISGEQLKKLQLDLEQRGTKKLLIIKDGHVVWEWFAEDWQDSVRRHYTASMAKALVGGMSLMVALEDGLITADMPACLLIPEWKTHPQKSKITIRQLATHTSGLEDAEVSDSLQQQLKLQGIDPHKGLAGWKGQFWRQEPDPFTVSRDSAQVLYVPGQHYNYSNPGIGMLSYAVTASLQGSAHSNIRDLLWDRIYRPLGIEKSDLSMGYGRTFEVDGLALVPSWGGGSSTADAAARVAKLMMDQGKWQQRQLVSPEVPAQVLAYFNTAIAGSNPEMVSETYSLRSETNPVPATTMGWYSNFDKVWNHVPADAFVAAGAGHQLILAIPSMDLIVVRFGDDLSGDSSDGFWYDAENYLFNPIMDAVVESPCPPSHNFACHFEPASNTLRMAEGSDNWPMTWAADDQLYTAYGDGWGFDPRTDIKLSLGLAKITGTPPTVQGVNIRTPSGERVGQGKYGVKASGMLSIDGTLYMLVRNAQNSQLAWSHDRGANWNWADWTFKESFGCPTFLNFGKDYQGARDDYVYIYSQDHATAYVTADHMVLMRINKEQLRNRDSYQFFAGFGDQDQPLWTEDVKKRKPVFSNPGKCYRSGITYNAGLDKYLWSQIIPLATDEEGPRFRGGLGIFMADEPWGPWETVFYQREWDIGPGESTGMPAKWISKDGNSFYLVFSGDDYFSVRKGSFD